MNVWTLREQIELHKFHIILIPWILIKYIFLLAALWNCGLLTYYQTIFDYVRARGGEVILNSGGGLEECFMPAFDIALNGEMTWATYNSSWRMCKHITF